jgi:hypothetical protein
MKDVLVKISNTKGGLKTMKAISKTWEKIFTAITFAEAGEFESAREFLRERDEKRDSQVIRKTIRSYAQRADRR